MRMTKVRKFYPRAWQNIGWRYGRIGFMWSKVCDQNLWSPIDNQRYRPTDSLRSQKSNYRK